MAPIGSGALHCCLLVLMLKKERTNERNRKKKTMEGPSIIVVGALFCDFFFSQNKMHMGGKSWELF